MTENTPTNQVVTLKAEPNAKSLGPWALTFRQITRNRFGMIGLVLLVFLIIIAVFAPVVAPYDPYQMKLSYILKFPGNGHLLGTDELGRDLLSRLIYGSRVSLMVGVIVVGISGTIGVALGAISGYFGGWVDNVIMRVVDILMAFPFLILAIIVVAVIGSSLTNMMLVLAIISWVDYARVVRGSVLSIKEEEFVDAARVIGVKDSRMIMRHIIPNTLGIVVVQATFGVASAILSAASLSFLGMGAQPPTAEWGAMLNTANKFIRLNPLLSILPGVAIMITVMAINFLGDALRDALDPRILKV